VLVIKQAVVCRYFLPGLQSYTPCADTGLRVLHDSGMVED